MPSKCSGLCTLEWMWGVLTKACYCPREDDVNRKKKCFAPPPIRDLIAKLESTLRPIVDSNRDN